MGKLCFLFISPLQALRQTPLISHAGSHMWLLGPLSVCWHLMTNILLPVCWVYVHIVHAVMRILYRIYDDCSSSVFFFFNAQKLQFCLCEFGTYSNARKQIGNLIYSPFQHKTVKNCNQYKISTVLYVIFFHMLYLWWGTCWIVCFFVCFSLCEPSDKRVINVMPCNNNPRLFPFQLPHQVPK